MKKTTAITISMNRTNSAVDGEQRMTSVEIAELTGKSHFNVMKAIRNMEPAWVNVGQFHFELTSYTDAQGKERPCYSLTKTECLLSQITDHSFQKLRFKSDK